MDTVETITIKGSDGAPLRINASDFDPAKHELYDDKAGSGATGGDAGKTDDSGNGGAPAGGSQNSGGPVPGMSQAPAGAPAPKGAAKPA